MHGRSEDRLTTLSSVLIAADRLEDASRIADEMIADNGSNRIEGWYKQATIAILRGRFARAGEALQSASLGGMQIGINSSVLPALFARRGLASGVGSPDGLEAALADILEMKRRLGAPRVPIEFEQALLHARPSGCPDLKAWTARIPEGQARDEGRLKMLRAAAAVGCASCRDVVAG